MNKRSFITEYNKLLSEMDRFKNEYDRLIRESNLKFLFEALINMNILSHNTSMNLEFIFNTFKLKINNTEEKYIPYIYEKQTKLKLKRKELLKYIHPDKLNLMYNQDMSSYYEYSTYLFTQIDGKCSLDILNKIFTDNYSFFNIVTKKLLNDCKISNNELKMINGENKRNIYFSQHKPSLNKVYDIFSVELNYFFILYSQLSEIEPNVRFSNDVTYVIEDVITFLNNRFKNLCKELEKYTLRILEQEFICNYSIILSQTNAINILQILKLLPTPEIIDVLKYIYHFFPLLYKHIVSESKIYGTILSSIVTITSIYLDISKNNSIDICKNPYYENDILKDVNISNLELITN